MAIKTHNKGYSHGRLIYQYGEKVVGKHGVFIRPAERVLADWNNGTPRMRVILQVQETVNKRKRDICPKCGGKRKKSKDADVYVCPGCDANGKGRVA